MALEALHKLVSNALGELSPGTLLAGILGDWPSTYAKSPAIWNPVFKALGLDAVYVPFDVPKGSLGAMVDALRETPEYVGGNVTVPYKVEVIRYLERLDPLAESIGAVNTIARDPDGGLAGYNTDAHGALDALVKALPGQAEPFLASLEGARVLLLGAGGAANAVAFALAPHLAGGRMWFANRSTKRAAELVARLRDARLPAEVVEMEALEPVIETVTLVVNATSVGQSGLRPLPGGGTTILEPYSPLARAEAPALGATDPAGLRAWARAAAPSIAENTRRSLDLLGRLPVGTHCFDLIYSPFETTFLRFARLAGYPTLNGKTMNICQAVAAFLTVMKDEVASHGIGQGAVYGRILELMSAVW